VKKRKFIIVGCLVAVLVLALFAQSHGAQTIRAPGISPRNVDISIAGTEFMNCLNASNLTLSQNDSANLQIVSDVLNDPYCCEMEAISEERHACLDENIVALKHMERMLRKTLSDKKSKCYGVSSSMAPLVCVPVAIEQDLNGEIHYLTSCVRQMISGIATQYDLLTKCPGN
jgi:hypothetical protein